MEGLTAMIPGSVLFCTGLVGIACCAVPALAALLLYKKCGGNVSAFFLGCGMYLLFNVMLNSTVGAIVSMTSAAEKLWFVVLYSGLSAALMDGFGRIAAFRWALKRNLCPTNAMLYGLGFGWVDCVLLLGIDSIYSAAFGSAYNRDPAALEALGAPEMVAALTQQLKTTDIGQLLASGVDRLLAVVLQMALAQLMMTAIAKTKGGYTILAILLQHVCVCAIVWMDEITGSILLGLVIRLVFTAVAILLALRTKEYWEQTKKEEAAKLSETWNAPLPRRPL